MWKSLRNILGGIKDPSEEDRKFEYLMLQERILRDSVASYTILAAMVAFSEAILITVLATMDTLDFFEKVAASIVALSCLSLWYLVDRRFAWAESQRIARQFHIERELEIFNVRLFDDHEIQDADVLNGILRVDRRFGVYSSIRVHHIYLGFIILNAVAWIILILSRSI